MEQEVKNTGAEDLQAFKQPLTIYTSPCFESFRTQLGLLFAHIDHSLSNEPLREMRFQEPLVIWDGVNRLGERKLISLVPNEARDQKIAKVSILFPTDEEQPNKLRVHGWIEMTSDPDRMGSEIFVGHSHEFLNYFQSVCKATEDCFTPEQIATAAKGAQEELANDAAKLKRRMHTRNLETYQIKLYQTFLALLSNLKYSAY